MILYLIFNFKKHSIILSWHPIHSSMKYEAPICGRCLQAIHAPINPLHMCPVSHILPPTILCHRSRYFHCSIQQPRIAALHWWCLVYLNWFLMTGFFFSWTCSWPSGEPGIFFSKPYMEHTHVSISHLSLSYVVFAYDVSFQSPRTWFDRSNFHDNLPTSRIHIDWRWSRAYGKSRIVGCGSRDIASGHRIPCHSSPAALWC